MNVSLILNTAKEIFINSLNSRSLLEVSPEEADTLAEQALNCSKNFHMLTEDLIEQHRALFDAVTEELKELDPDKFDTEEQKAAFNAGYDSYKNGANMTNSHFKFFLKDELAKAWTAGRRKAENENT